jgi:hypothetical protein
MIRHKKITIISTKKILIFEEEEKTAVLFITIVCSTATVFHVNLGFKLQILPKYSLHMEYR